MARGCCVGQKHKGIKNFWKADGKSVSCQTILRSLVQLLRARQKYNGRTPRQLSRTIQAISRPEWRPWVRNWCAPHQWGDLVVSGPPRRENHNWDLKSGKCGIFQHKLWGKERKWGRCDSHKTIAVGIGNAQNVEVRRSVCSSWASAPQTWLNEENPRSHQQYSCSQAGNTPAWAWNVHPRIHLLTLGFTRAMP